MLQPIQSVEQLTPLQNAVLVAKQIQAKLDTVEAAQTEPIAIIGVGCRFPGGGDSPASFWKMLCDGVDAIREVPADRWDIDAYYDPDPAVPGKMYTRWGGFLERVDQFDPDFFGISPREAPSIDPQQRLLLETTWEALDNAGQPQAELAGTRTGVFVGLIGNDYAQILCRALDELDGFAGTGSAHSIAANRLSYVLNLRGPSVALDTACSSSLVTAHLACQSLRRGESDLALAGGVNLIVAPEITVALSKARMLSPDGRCKTFDADANGYVRGEGCGVIVLKRLSDAQVDGDSILAVIRGTAVNHDGRSNGLSAPNGTAQQEVISAALQDAGIEPREIGYVEAHGTGTRLGDPIEVEALRSVLGYGRAPDEPLMVGSVKTNIGHLEGAAGIAGLIKAALTLKFGLIPPHLNVKTINPLLESEETPLLIPTTPKPWPRGPEPRYAGVSSFGFGGTNAHLVLEEPPAEIPVTNKIDRPRHILTMSARSVAELNEMAERLQEQLENDPSPSTSDVAFAANTGRTHFNHRLAVVADSIEEVRDKLRKYTTGRNADGVRSGQVMGDQTSLRVAFLFTGQGAQYVGMGRELFETQPTFREAMQRCDEYLRPHLDRPLLSVIDFQSGDDSLLNQTAYAQPALFALEYALAEMWRSWGIEPSAVMGHSVGEYVAACVAGVFGLEDGLKLITKRAQLMQALPSGGSMAAIFASDDQVRQAIGSYGDRVAIAAFNGPESVVISGEEDAIREIVATLRDKGVRSKPVATSHAFHSSLLDPMLDALEQVASEVEFQAPKIDLISNLTGKPVDEQTLADPSYWRRHVRQAVQFAAGMQSLMDRDYRTFVEIGPSATLLGMARRCVPGDEIFYLPSLRRSRGNWQTVLETLGTLYTRGTTVDWSGFDQDYDRRRVDLPNYPFQRQRFWSIESSTNDPITAWAMGDANRTSHPLLGNRLRASVPEWIFQSRLSSRRPATLADHRVQGKVILPATAKLEMALAAAVDLGDGPWNLEEVAILQPLVFEGESPRTVQTIVEPEGGGAATFRVVSLDEAAPAAEPSFTTHAVGRIRAELSDEVERNGCRVDIARERARFTSESFDHEWRAKALQASGLEPGPTFCWIERHWLHDNETLGEMRAARDNDRAEEFQIHPGLLDAGLQLLGAALPDAANGIGTYVPVGLDRLRLVDRPTGETCYFVKLKSHDGSVAVGDIRLADVTGRVLMEIEGVRLKRVSRDWLTWMMPDPNPDWLYELAWQPQPLEPSAETQISTQPGRWLIFDDHKAVGSSLARELEARGECCHVVRPGADQQLKALVKDFVANDGAPGRGVIYAAGLDVGSMAASDTLDLETARELGWGGVLDLVHAVTETDASQPPRLWLLTSGAQAVGAKPCPLVVEQATVWGLGRVIAAEHPELACMRIDLDPDPAIGDNKIDGVVNEMLAGGREDQLAFRQGTRHVARLKRVDDDSEDERLSIPQGQPCRLEITSRGELSNLTLRPVVRSQPGPSEVEIRVRATGLNFRDVLNVLDLYPGDAGQLGGECSGEIVAVGSGVQGLAVGDRVVALAPGSFSTFVTTLSSFVAHKPEHVSFEEAATMPIALLTADYALRQLGGMKAGDRVLIHAASGGVGLAAVQLAQKVGAEVFATAGNPEKRAYLRSLGIEHVMDSRSLDFAEETLESTARHGVDLVLNSLTGESIAESLSVLAPGGRFLEIGKTDLWDGQRVAEVNPDVSFHVIALDQMMADDPKTVGALLQKLMLDCQAKAIDPLPHRVFQIQSAIKAFRHMARASHIGKVVLAAEPEVGSSEERLTLADDGTYLITGGLGGLGLRVARWLVDRGARHLVLVGRSAPSDYAGTIVEELETTGVQVMVSRADVTQPDDVAKVLEDIDANLPPLRGVFHAAGVLDDGVLREQTRERFDHVMAGKVGGAWNLHVQLQDRLLDMFVLFSSAASLLGSPGQGNYAAANAFLDGLAHRRRSAGLSALTVNWGPWSDVGMAANLEHSEGQRWAAAGMGWIEPTRGLQTLEQLILQDRTQVGVLPIDWSKFFQRIPSGAEPPWLSDIVPQNGRPAAAASEPQRLLKQLEQATASERRDLVLKFVREQAALVLGVDSSDPPDTCRPLNELGFDSLMAVELCNGLGHAIGQHLNPTLLFDYPTLEALAIHLANDVLRLESVESSETPNREQENETEDEFRTQALADVQGLSEEQIDSIVTRAIAQLDN